MTPADNYEAVAAELRAKGFVIGGAYDLTGGADEFPPPTPEEEAWMAYVDQIVWKAYRIKRSAPFPKLPQPTTP